MFIITHRHLFLSVAGGLAVLALGLIFVLGLDLGIEFTGGSTIEIQYEEEVPSQGQVEERTGSLFERQILVRPAGDGSYLIQTPFIEEGRHDEVRQALTFDGRYEMTEKRFSSVGPSLGSELTKKAVIAVAVVILAIIIFVAFSFRRGTDKDGVPLYEGVSSWYYGLAAVAALGFDILIPTAMFAILGAVMGAEVDVLFVTALLAILGFSVNDTIVVFDRVRENLRLNYELHRQESFLDTVGRSLEQSYARSINTSLTTALVLLALFVLGGQVTQAFALTLLVGILSGTYSSLFLAAPLLVKVQEWSQVKNKK